MIFKDEIREKISIDNMQRLEIPLSYQEQDTLSYNHDKVSFIHTSFTALLKKSE